MHRNDRVHCAMDSKRAYGGAALLAKRLSCFLNVIGEPELILLYTISPYQQLKSVTDNPRPIFQERLAPKIKPLRIVSIENDTQVTDALLPVKLNVGLQRKHE